MFADMNSKLHNCQERKILKFLVKPDYTLNCIYNSAGRACTPSKMPSYGRGGAGNIQAVEQANAKIFADLEANQATAETQNKEPLPTDYLEREQQQYVHTGRGGMGNYASPRDLKDNGVTMDRDSTSQVANDSARTPGRGGAGNYAFGASQSQRRAAQERLKEDQSRERLKLEIEKSVKETLAMPQKAKVPGGEPHRL